LRNGTWERFEENYNFKPRQGFSFVFLLKANMFLGRVLLITFLFAFFIVSADESELSLCSSAPLPRRL